MAAQPADQNTLDLQPFGSIPDAGSQAGSEAARPKAPVVEPDLAEARTRAQSKAEVQAAKAARSAQKAEAKAARKAQKQAARTLAREARREQRAERARNGLRFGFAQRLLRPLTSAPAMVFLAFIIAPGMLLGARKAIVTAAPGTAKLYAAIGMPVNLDGLDLRDVSSVLKSDDSGRYLLIRGEITNLRNGKTRLPNLQLALRGPDGRAMYTWQAPSPTKSIKARDSIHFVARLDSPPEGAKDVVVEFARKDG
ncbi:MAG: hypothetical protein KDJ29_18740 [Hyphomicrobiales bacterium]|nr:hypothetical protein [Hyphomicrobiales bacterium]